MQKCVYYAPAAQWEVVLGVSLLRHNGGAEGRMPLDGNTRTRALERGI